MKKIFINLLFLCVFSINLDVVSHSAPVCPTKPAIQYMQVSSSGLVNKPQLYLGKNIKITATFNKFSSLGLDYKPAMRSSKEYVSFLIKRENTGDTIIPLSEVKFFIKKDKAEKMDIESGDKVEITGKVFSNALGDAWVDVSELKNLTPKPAKTKK